MRVVHGGRFSCRKFVVVTYISTKDPAMDLYFIQMSNFILQSARKKNLSMLVKNICKSSDTEKYVYELKDNKYIETVFIKRRDGGTVCVSTKSVVLLAVFFVSPDAMVSFVI